ncbi:MAG TPA: bifunctional diaminohydroxyphosphoribosylaminopyrimidine deaminase/5-amino-6-(5-phosphoribosylamino)uracil reductase RibD [Dehalococcoidia bacterium]|nr:bifunctional diaminohydroxyphosphoribosylaminopyrimidine deaminase/5-amino-6-(5-phosphoribosylamino)uracil reductase RibD [Dehalococcoidia bacterium]
MPSEETSEYMQRALELARAALGTTSPNPTVGAVVVLDGEIVGEGAYSGPGTPHAEIVALERAGEAARGATVYVTLEPCSHSRARDGQPRTPCAQALIAAGVARVVYSIDDPDERTAGSGAASLAAAGIAVQAGEGEAEARRINEAFIKHRTRGLPFVVAKFAASLDGRIAAASGDSRWVSGPRTLEWAHELRTRVDAILVGSSTVVVDDPLLTARPGGRDAVRQPLRVVVDSRGRTPPMARVLGGPARTLIATLESAPERWRAALQAAGAEVLSFPEDGGRVDLQALLRELAERDVLSLLVEGGGVILGGFFDRGLVDKLHAVIAPLIIGAEDAPAAVAGRGAYRMADALRLRDITVERLGEDLLVTGYPQYPETKE